MQQGSVVSLCLIRSLIPELIVKRLPGPPDLMTMQKISACRRYGVGLLQLNQINRTTIIATRTIVLFMEMRQFGEQGAQIVRISSIFH